MNGFRAHVTHQAFFSSGVTPPRNWVRSEGAKFLGSGILFSALFCIWPITKSGNTTENGSKIAGPVKVFKSALQRRSKRGLRWSSRWSQGSRRRYLAGQLYGLRSGLRRSGGKSSATARQSVWRKSVTHVADTFCHLYVRAGQKKAGGEGGTRTGLA
jgi:hypothetical protein